MTPGSRSAAIVRSWWTRPLAPSQATVPTRSRSAVAPPKPAQILARVVVWMIIGGGRLSASPAAGSLEHVADGIDLPPAHQGDGEGQVPVELDHRLRAERRRRRQRCRLELVAQPRVEAP